MRQDILTGLLAGAVDSGEQWELADAVNVLATRLQTGHDAPSLVQVRRACAALNARCRHEQCRVLGQAWHDSSPPDLAIFKHLIQAQIDLSMLDAAQSLFDESQVHGAYLPDGAGKRAEQIELAGLAARILKQRFVDAQDPDLLERACLAYQDVYEAQALRPFWHGVNVVALRARAEREGVPLAGASSKAWAGRVYADLLARDGRDPWRLAGLSELSLALGRGDEAELWLYRFMLAPDATPFMLESLRRQLHEVWRGTAAGGESGCADRLLAILTRYQMTRLGTVAIEPDSVRGLRSAALEKVFSDVNGFSIGMIRRMLQACQSIGCVSNGLGARLGTGFMLCAGDLGGDPGDRLFMTNAHVLSDTVPGAVAVADALVSFELSPDAGGLPVFYRVAELVYTSAPGALGVPHPVGELLDVTIVRLRDVPASVQGLRVAANLPLIDGRARAYVIGHPRGSGLQVSLHDSELLAYDGAERLIHYRTPTDPGSSGSPVFNEDWHLIAIHHGGSFSMPRLKPPGGTYQANEGVTMAAIRAGLERRGVPAAREAAAS
jgi:hypothetical protein